MKRGVEFDNNKDIWALISEANQLISMIILWRVQGCFHWCKKVGSVSVWPLQNLPRNWYKLIKIAREYKKESIDQFNFNPCQLSYVHEYQMWSVMFTRSFESNHIRIEKDGWHSIPYVWKGNAERIRGLRECGLRMIREHSLFVLALLDMGFSFFPEKCSQRLQLKV